MCRLGGVNVQIIFAEGWTILQDCFGFSFLIGRKDPGLCQEVGPGATVSVWTKKTDGEMVR